MTVSAGRYRGRFAPSPTGPLHMGSLVTALATWLDARAHGGQWLVRIEDIDYPRCVRGADIEILETLERLGLVPDEPPVWQSRREALYADALHRLDAAGQLYPCGCSRKEIADSLLHVRERHQTLGYPGTCRHGLNGKLPRAWRVRVPDGPAATICFDDRWQGRQCQDLETEVGDFVLRRADGLWAYQLAVVVDDGLQGITHIVRGADLLDSTPRQIHLQHLLGLPTPSYLHVPVVVNAIGEKLSKQSGAQAIDTNAPLDALRAAGDHLGLRNDGNDVKAWLERATGDWLQRLATLPAAAGR
ncbi:MULTISPECIES: tRNA glutamyl-Q(34) synthetase GluQRS [Cupriavidus]|uniref:Glutamyl-Q tRNA(Asp) synthetase n=2 Tax=Cupriavidus pinatubonensis TaxID=248026 RepID=Q474A4_CUPPJ|nr:MULTISPECIES: tRNA glutamyl-Q(34) synthetase GluQRS [Cupriavidus]QYY32473.1 tRNA glutamyl-Q(34) synthetase GluQRS [Cupriavidus pinatubonensis]TPQ34515.1 tRNA glutamyl-Q(34) synthetase GluQRS [Cupriavidus pinatubonensis]CAG9174160.1 Glutamyl-Q tRNA(Asp) synthetase [Cupriavidus pinatubonensis]